METAISNDRVATWREVITYLERHPEDFKLLVTMAALDASPDTVTFVADQARYATQRGINDDWLGFGHYGHCGNCYAPVAVFPDRLVDWPLPEHRCAGTKRRPRAVEAAAAPVESPQPQAMPAAAKRGLDI